MSLVVKVRGLTKLFCLFICVDQALVKGLECYHCYNANDASVCKNHVTCPDGNLCGVEHFGSIYNLGCAQKEACVNFVPFEGPPLVGKREHSSALVSRREQSLKIRCCDTDLCNLDPDHVHINGNSTGSSNTTTVTSPNTTATTPPKSSLVPPSSYTKKTDFPTLPTKIASSCVDHYGCPEIVKLKGACEDVKISTTLCPLSCGKCCDDVSSDCAILINRLSICQTSRDFAIKRCRRSCSLCNITFEPIDTTATSWQSGTGTDRCTDEPVCALMMTNGEDVCSVNASLCRRTCNQCQSHSLSSTTPITSTLPTDIQTTPQYYTSPHCRDDPDCGHITDDLNGCSFPEIANKVCPKTCQTCCGDLHPDCRLLNITLNICMGDQDFAMKNCRWTCNMCNEGSIMSTSSRSTSPATMLTRRTDTPSGMANTQTVTLAVMTNTQTVLPSMTTNTHTVTPAVTTNTQTLPPCRGPDHDDCTPLLGSGLDVCGNSKAKTLCPAGCHMCRPLTTSSMSNISTTTTSTTTSTTAAATTTIAAATTTVPQPATTKRTTGVIVVG